MLGWEVGRGSWNVEVEWGEVEVVKEDFVDEQGWGRLEEEVAERTMVKGSFSHS